MTVTGSDYNRLISSLDGYSHNALVHMCGALGLLGDDRPRKSDLIARLAMFLGQPAHLSVVERLLEPKHWHALALDRLKIDEVVLYALYVRLLALGVDEAEAASILRHLLSLGCLLCAPTASGPKIDLDARTFERFDLMRRQVFSLPPLLQRAAQDEMRLGSHGGEVMTPARLRQGTLSDLMREIYLALRAAASGQMRLTMKGIPFKADAARLSVAAGSRQMSATGGASGSNGRGKAKSVDPSARLWFVLSLLKRSNLTDTSDGRMQATPAMDDFLAAPAHEQARTLYAAWLDCAFSEFRRIETLADDYQGNKDQLWVEDDPYVGSNSDHPGWTRLRGARRAIDRMLRQGAGERGDWVELSRFATAVWASDPEFLVPLLRPDYYGYSYGRKLTRTYESIRRRGGDYQSSRLVVGLDWPEVEGAYVTQVMAEPLHWLGLIDLGLDAAGRIVSFRLTPLGRHVLLEEAVAAEPVARADGPELVVQPNFDVVVFDADANYGLLTRLDEFAERRSLDRAAIYSITRESIVRGLDRGTTGQAILETLEKSGRGPLPQNVRYSIEEWVRLFERVHVRGAATLLEADSPQQLDSWLADSALGPLIGKRLAPSTALVPVKRLDDVLNLLKERKQQLSVVDYTRRPRRLFRVEAPADIYVPAKHDEPYLRFRLGRFAERLPDDDSGEARYHITPASVGRALASGLTVPNIMNYLVNVASPEVPADALLRVRGWGGAYKPLRYESVVAVEMPPGFDWAEIAAVPEIDSLILRRLGQTLALVGVDKFELLRAALAERGIELQAGLPAQEAAPAAAPEASSGAPAASPVRGRTLEDLADLIGLGVRGLRATAETEKAAQRVAEAPRELRRGDTLELTELEGEALRTFFEKAIWGRRVVVVGYMDEDDDVEVLRMVPTALRWAKEQGRYFVEGLCEDCDESHKVDFDDIIGVARMG